MSLQIEYGDRAYFPSVLEVILRKGRANKGAPHLRALHPVYDEAVQYIESRDAYRGMEEVMTLVQGALERVDSASGFKVLSSLYAVALKRNRAWPSQVHPGFADFVDVVVGWMVDEEGEEDVTPFCSDFLRGLGPFFRAAPAFPRTLVSQVIKDLEAEGDNNTPTAFKRSLLLVKAYTTLLTIRCVKNAPFQNDLTERMLAATLKILKRWRMRSKDPSQNSDPPGGKEGDPTPLGEILSDLFRSANEAIILSPGTDGPATQEFLKTEISALALYGESYSKENWGRIWRALSSYITGLLLAPRGNQVGQDVFDLMESFLSTLDQVDSWGREGVGVVQALLKTRNPRLLQKVWAWLLQKKEEAPSFVLAGISDIVKKKEGSILILYGLDPSIFSFLLAMLGHVGEGEEVNPNAKPVDERTRRSALLLLKVHCVTHNHWVSSLSTQGTRFSSGNLGAANIPRLLTFWGQSLYSLKTSEEEKAFILKWIYQFLVSSHQFATFVFQLGSAFFKDLFRFLLVEDTEYHWAVRRRVEKPPPPFNPNNKWGRELGEVEAIIEATRRGQVPILPSSSISTAPKPPSPTPAGPNPSSSTTVSSSPSPTPTPQQKDVIYFIPWPFLKEGKQVLGALTQLGNKYREIEQLQSDLRSSLLSAVVSGREGNEGGKGGRSEEIRTMAMWTLTRSPVLLVTKEEAGPLGLTMADWAEGKGKASATLPTMGGNLLYRFLDTEGDSSSSGDQEHLQKKRKLLTRSHGTLLSFNCNKAGGVGLAKRAYSLPEDDPSPMEIQAGVDHIVKMKLKTNLGKPAELFAGLQAALQQTTPTSQWRLRFIFWLQQASTLWTSLSTLKHYDLNENIRTFFTLNKAPCSEWFRRLGQNAAEACVIRAPEGNDGDPMKCPCPSEAYFFSSLAEDFEGARVALFLLGDEEGVQGLDDPVTFLYLSGRFQEALEELLVRGKGEPPEDEVWKVVGARAAEMLSRAWTHAPQGKRYAPLLLPPTEDSPSILDNQLRTLLKDRGDTIRWGVKGLMFQEDKEELGLWTFLKVAGASKRLLRISPGERESLWLSLGERMLENGNLHWVENVLKGMGIDLVTLREKGHMLPMPVPNLPAEGLFLAAKLCMALKDPATAAKALGQVLFITRRNLERMPLTERVLLFFAHNLATTKYIEALVPLIFPQGEPEALVPTEPVLSVLEKATKLRGQDSEAWLSLGHLLYGRDDKKGAFLAYSSHFRNTGAKPKRIENLRASCRLLGLVKEDPQLLDSLQYKVSELLTSERWLDFLPEIGQVPCMMPAMLERFPSETALFLWGHAEEMVNDGCPCPPWDDGGVPTCLDDFIQLKWKTSLPSLNPLISLLGEELLRLGTSLEELWSTAIQRVLADWNKRASALKKDQGKVAAFISPVVEYLTTLWDWTKETASTPAQQAFVLRHGKQIPELLAALALKGSLEGLLSSFEDLLNYAETLDSWRANKTPLGTLSPKLACVTNWGDETVTLLGMRKGVFVAGVSPSVTSLPTKTKPKKLRILGTDGRGYEYLVKGGENMGVDAGMMQFLTLSSLLLGKPIWSYAVTPLGVRGGLIQMVEGAVPVFQLYKAHLLKASPKERTTDVYWRKISEVCGGHGHQGHERRKRVTDPLKLKEVFNSLKNESPKDLISREFLIRAPDPPAWYRMVKGYTRDSGIAAGIGYVLGVGDRHLDNILVDLREGKLIHVDFSLLFGRGEALRVPELVPFRLTQNFKEALQFPRPQDDGGHGGPFAAYLDNTVTTLGENRDILEFATRNIALATLVPSGTSCTDVFYISKNHVDSLVKKTMEKVETYKNAQSLIKEATSDSNLSKMFEGWSPWI